MGKCVMSQKRRFNGGCRYGERLVACEAYGHPFLFTAWNTDTDGYIAPFGNYGTNTLEVYIRLLLIKSKIFGGIEEGVDGFNRYTCV